MSTLPVSSAELEDAPLNHEQWWELFDQLRLSQQPDYAPCGGPVAFIPKQRDADADLV